MLQIIREATAAEWAFFITATLFVAFGIVDVGLVDHLVEW